jgi:hypothetical protein
MIDDGKSIRMDWPDASTRWQSFLAADAAEALEMIREFLPEAEGELEGLIVIRERG